MWHNVHVTLNVAVCLQHCNFTRACVRVCFCATGCLRHSERDYDTMCDTDSITLNVTHFTLQYIFHLFSHFMRLFYCVCVCVCVIIYLCVGGLYPLLLVTISIRRDASLSISHPLFPPSLYHSFTLSVFLGLYVYDTISAWLYSTFKLYRLCSSFLIFLIFFMLTSLFHFTPATLSSPPNISKYIFSFRFLIWE